MADKKYQLGFAMSDGTTKSVEFTAPQGPAGNSVTVESVNESAEDGGVNVVKFSDGNELNVCNGKTGAAGVGITSITITEV